MDNKENMNNAVMKQHMQEVFTEFFDTAKKQAIKQILLGNHDLRSDNVTCSLLDVDNEAETSAENNVKHCPDVTAKNNAS